MSESPEQNKDVGTPSRKRQREDSMSKRASNEEVDSDPQLNKLTSILNDLANVENGKEVSAIICYYMYSYTLHSLTYSTSISHNTSLMSWICVMYLPPSMPSYKI